MDNLKSLGRKVYESVPAIPESVKKAGGQAKEMYDKCPTKVKYAIVGGAVVPLAVGTVHLIGFGTAGIVKGTFAAKMMAASAPIAKGSMVAICQSVGAAGLATSTKMSMVLAGTTLGAGTASAKKD